MIRKALGRCALLTEKHERVIRGGNGDGLGLAATVKGLQDTISSDHLLLIGDEDSPGLKGKVQSSQEDIARMTKFLYLIGGAGVTGIIIAILTHSIKIP